MIKVCNLTKSFSRQVLRKITFEIKKGEFVVIFGPNGCGKTTLLNIIAGVMQPDKGEVVISGRHTKDEKIGYVFQNYRDSLLPWRTNLENIAFPLELEGIPSRERLRKAKNLVKSLNLKIPLTSYPYQCSGGEQQLVALLREVIAKPKIILMDEPFSALHYQSRNYLKLKVQEIWKKLNLTILFVTHDISEAMQLGNRILTINSGKITKRGFRCQKPVR